MGKFKDTMDALGSSGADDDGSSNIAGQYDGMSTGPRMSYSFEEQEGVPVDGSSKMPRNLSPFTIRLVPPSTEDLPAEFISGSQEPDPNLYQAATQSVEYNNQAAASVLGAYGISSVGAGASAIADTLQQQIANGQALNTSSGTQIRTTLTDSLTAMDITAQVARILATPPLTLLINPEDMNITYTSVQNYSERGREGFIFQRWGEEQPNIKFSGSTGAFIAGEDTGFSVDFGGVDLGTIPSLGAINTGMSGKTTTPTGVQFSSKRNSAAFQNFQTLYQFYRNNGYVYDTVGGTEAHLMIGAVAIDYDQWTYVGHIESFEYAYDSEDPHRIVWSMEFVVDSMYDLAPPTYMVLPLESPIPNPSDPGGGGSNSTGVRGTSSNGWFSITGAEGDGGLGAVLAEEFCEVPFDVTWGYGAEAQAAGGAGTLTNPDGTPRNS
jgi:hypothetical protein